MKILHVSDLHANWAWFDWVGAQTGHDLLIVAGDLQNTCAEVEDLEKELENQLQNIINWAEILPKIPTVICSGNHDDETLLDQIKHLRHIHSDGWNGIIHDVWVTIAPFRWEDDKKSNIKTYGMLKDPRRSPKLPWLFVSHRPPVGKLGRDTLNDADSGINSWMGSLPIDYVFCGHSHFQPGINQTCFEKIGNGVAFNPGSTARSTQEKSGIPLDPIPNHIQFDISSKKGVWYQNSSYKTFEL